MNDTHCLTPLSPAEAQQVDETCDRFEAAWNAGERPRPEDYLGAADSSVRPALLRELLILDWHYRLRAGDDPSADDYRTRFPGDSTVIKEVGREMAVSAGDSGPGAERRGEGTASVADSDRYHLAEVIGRGGMGVVFRGRDRHLGRELAVKVLQEGFGHRPDARRRFLAEARVGSQLQHPAIVPVYELGRFGDRRPYITMKLVEGRTLAALLRDRADPGQDLPRFVGVFEHVCQAMAYAHSKGVVHRDLKPANVMVGAFGEVQVMDWGFAKVLDEGPDAAAPEGGAAAPDSARWEDRSDGETHSGAMLGTPAYMPPEQARGDAARVDRRADVFALGALLCEILTGSPPYVGRSAEEVCAMAAAASLGDARTRLDACGADAALRDLAWRCLAAKPDARPPDAGVVARDVTAYLASAQERLRQAQLERAASDARAEGARARARLTLALAAALLVGASVATWQAVVATTAKQQALAAAAAEKDAKDVANAKEAETRGALDFIVSSFKAAKPVGQPGGLGRDVTLRRVLEVATRAVGDRFANHPLAEARLRVTLGESFAALSEPKVAAEQYARAREIYGERLGPGHRDTLAAMNNLAMAYTALGRPADAVQLHEETLALRQARLGPDDPDTLISLNNLAIGYNLVGRGADAQALREKAVPLFRARLGPDHPHTLALMVNLANGYVREGRYADAVTLYEQTLERQKVKPGPDRDDTLMTMTNLANVYQKLGRLDEALRLTEQTLAVRRARLGDTHRHTLHSVASLAAVYRALGRHAEGFKLSEEALEGRRTHLGPDHDDTLSSLYDLGQAHAALGRHADALQAHEQALERRRARLGADHPQTLDSMAAVAEALTRVGRGADAVPIIDDCVRRASGQVAEPRLYSEILEVRLNHFRQAKDAAGCAATAEMWEKLGRTDAAGLHTAARYRAVTAKLVRATTPSAQVTRQADAEADRAMVWLTKAVAAGFKDAAKMKADRDLDALRDRADFRALLASLETGD